jgi:hypothetical protein
MINLTKNKRNTVVFTLTENEVEVSLIYSLKLINTQSYEEIDNILINDISLNPSRFNQFEIELATVYNDYTFNEDISTDSALFLTGNITIPAGVSVEISSDGVLVTTSSTIITGNLINLGDTIYVDDLNDNYWSNLNESLNCYNVTFILSDLIGFYDYEVYDLSIEPNKLEFGKLYVASEETNVISAIHNDEIIIAKRKN